MKYTLYIKAVIGAPFLLAGKFFNGVTNFFNTFANVALGIPGSDNGDDKLTRKYAEAVIVYFFGISLFIALSIALYSKGGNY